MSGQEFMNVISKDCLRLLFLDNKSKVENRQNGTIGLVKWRCKGLSNGTCLNVLKAKYIRWVEVVLSIEWDYKVVEVLKRESEVEKGNLIAGVQIKNNEADKKWEIKASIGPDNRAGIKRDNKLDIRQDDKAGTG